MISLAQGDMAMVVKVLHHQEKYQSKALLIAKNIIMTRKLPYRNKLQ